MERNNWNCWFFRPVEKIVNNITFNSKNRFRIIRFLPLFAIFCIIPKKAVAEKSLSVVKTDYNCVGDGFIFRPDFNEIILRDGNFDAPINGKIHRILIINACFNTDDTEP